VLQVPELALVLILPWALPQELEQDLPLQELLEPTPLAVLL
jgi:hypothetical protein